MSGIVNEIGSRSKIINGKVGIGTTAPARLLHVYNNTASTASEIKIENAIAGYNAALQIKTTVSEWDVGSNIVAAAGSFEVYERTGGSAASRFTILSGGNTGGANAKIQLGFGAAIDSTPDTTVMTLNQSGNVGIGTATPAATLDVNGDVRIGNSTRGHYLGEKSLTINGTTYTTALTIVLSDHNAAHVKLFLTGDWSGHSAVAYVGEYFIQNGAGGYAEPGMIISEFDNTATDFIESKIVDPTTDTFTIQLKLSDSDDGTITGQICYHVMGEVTSVT